MSSPESSAAVDVISQLADIEPGSPLAQLRAQRPEATGYAQDSYDALFNPTQAGGLSPTERLATALRVAHLHAAPAAAAHYGRRLVEAGASAAIVAAAAPDQLDPALPTRLRAVLRHADLLATQPRWARPDHLQALADAGLSATEIVTLSQVIAFVSFQVRLLAGLALLGNRSGAAGHNPTDTSTAAPSRPTAPPADRPAAARVIRRGDELNRPAAFTIERLDWAPWLEPLDLAHATPEQLAALDGRQTNSQYFRLLARDAAVLRARTATDRGIFYTPGGLPRPERELSAAATSRLNGCIYCASVHARLAAQLSQRTEDVERMLREGVGSVANLDLGARWQAIVELAVALAATPPGATADHLTRLRELGLSDLEILDIVQATAFFSWANRLMLTLGEPHYPSAGDVT
jgi:alkylhydroperoxidase domain protein/CMD domain protein